MDTFMYVWVFNPFASQLACFSVELFYSANHDDVGDNHYDNVSNSNSNYSFDYGDADDKWSQF